MPLGQERDGPSRSISPDSIRAEGKSTWADERGEGVTVEACCRYLDLELDRVFEKGETHVCSWERAKDLEIKGLARMV